MAGQIAGLAPFDFLLVVLDSSPPYTVEAARGEDGELTVEVTERPGEVELQEEQRQRLRRLGLKGSTAELPWRSEVETPEEASVLVERVLQEVFETTPDAAIDVRHGSHRAEHEAAQRLAEVRARIEPTLSSLLGHPPERDVDGDYVFDYDSVQVYVAPRAARLGELVANGWEPDPGVPVIVRVFAITNVGVNLSPELGLFLSRLNFGLAFGRFALDVEHQAVWFDETLRGEHASEDELEFTIKVVAETAGAWDERIAQMFGGMTRRAALAAATTTPVETPQAKPGEGGYL